MYFLSPFPFCPDNFLKKCPLPPAYPIFTLPLQKRRGIGRNNVYSPTNLWNNICLFLLVLVTFWFFLNECFYGFPCLICFFVRIFPHFYDQMKHKAGNRFYPPNKNNKPMETRQTKQRAAQFLVSQNFWWFTHIGHKRTQFRTSCVWYGFI